MEDAATRAHLVPPTRWLEAQRVTFGIALLNLFGTIKNVQRNEILNRVGEEFTALNIGERLNHTQDTAYRSRLSRLPPAVLESLANIDQSKVGDWLPHVAVWKEVLTELRSGGRIAGAKLMADRIMGGTLAPAQVVRIALSTLGGKWHDNPVLIEGIEALRAELARRDANSQDRLRALELFRRTCGVPPSWDVVENVMLQRCYAWPLLLLSFDAYDEPSPFALPVSLDVKFDGRGEVYWHPDQRSNPLINCNGWAGSLAQALEGAKKFWLSKRRSWPKSFIDSVQAASVLVDMSAAEEILRPYATRIWGFNGRFEVKDRSLETYLSLSIMADFFNAPSAVETICSTGWLKEAIPDAGGRANYEIEQPAEAGKKIACAMRSFDFDKFIVRARPESIGDTRHMRVCLGETLGDFADHVFRQKWRHHRYVRCPDISQAFKRLKSAGRNEGEIKEVNRWIFYNEDPVLVLPSEINVSSVAQALCEISRRAERAQETEEEKSKTGAHYAFVRAVPDETNERFWQVIWQLLDGEREEFERFKFSVSASSPALMLAALLNKFSPNVVDRRRAPDILVIVGAKHLFQDGYTLPHGPFSRLQLNHIASELNHPGLLKPTPNESIWKSIHQTRVILVPDSWDEIGLLGGELFLATPGDHDADTLELIDQLSIFRHGFLHHHARRLLGVTEGTCDHILARMQNLRTAGGHVLGYPEQSGEYFLKARMKHPRGTRTAALHLDAANAIAGFLRPNEDAARFDYGEALSPVWLHEAQWHLVQAMMMTRGRRQQGHEGIYREAQEAHYKLSRIGEPLSWSRVRWSVQNTQQGAEDTLEAVREHLTGSANDIFRQTFSRLAAHPLELMWSAKLAFVLAQGLKNDANQQARYSSLRREWLELAKRAHESCAALDQIQFDSTNEGDACRFAVATSTAVLILTESPDGDGLTRAAPYFRLAIALEDRAREIIDDEWFECLGDREYGHEAAACEYRKGIFNPQFKRSMTRPRLQTVVKYLGVLRQLGQSPEPELLAYLAALDYRARRFVRENPDAHITGLWKISFVADRWALGQEDFEWRLGPRQTHRHSAA
jgi:hypothetical protein